MTERLGTRVTLGLCAALLAMPGAALAAYHADSDTGVEALDYIENEHRSAREQRLTAEQEQLLKDVRVSRDTFMLDGITDFQIDTQQDTITADGIRYDYDENLKIFSEEELIPINRLSDGATICIRGQESRILTMVASGPEDSDDGPEETGFWN